MATVRDITSLCKEGKLDEAYALAQSDLQNDPENVWVQREMGWALYYTIKSDAVQNPSALIPHLTELCLLSSLTIPQDSMIFDNVMFALATYAKNKLSPSDINSFAQLSEIFVLLKKYNFEPSKGYSFLLQEFIRFQNWPDLADFIDWWNLEKLTSDDYIPFVVQNGNKLITLAERAYIAKSKALLKLNVENRICQFLPQLDRLIQTHPEMTYPGYFYGKLLLATGADSIDALRVLLPFVRRKSSEFWVWQLLSEVFSDDEEKRLACLLRAVHCRTKEEFLGSVRTRLAKMMIDQQHYDRARYHIDQVVRCYMKQGWRLAPEIVEWTHQNWIQSVLPNEEDPIDYKPITDEILLDGTDSAIAIVAYVDQKSHRASLIYGREKRMSQKLPFKVGVGAVLKINYVIGADQKPKLLNAIRVSLPKDLDYIKVVFGTIVKREDKPYAFLRVSGEKDVFISPDIVTTFKAINSGNAKGLVVYDYDKKKDVWNWTCVNLKML